MENAVLDVQMARTDEAVLAVKQLQTRLRANPDGLRAPLLRQAGQRLFDQCVPGAGSASRYKAAC